MTSILASASASLAKGGKKTMLRNKYFVKLVIMTIMQDPNLQPRQQSVLNNGNEHHTNNRCR